MSTLATCNSGARRRLSVVGVVQGVGFRPFVHRLATELGLAGHVGNDAAGVFIEIEGPAPVLERFEARLEADAPPLAQVDRVDSVSVEPLGESGFRIADSRDGGGGPARTFVSPDVAVCGACLDELLDPSDRRYRYPFVNCTDCGPRFTITIDLPYDRPNTTMASFELCPDCAAEYRDPTDRRFHAEPIACPACGPRLWFESAAGRVDGTDAALAAAHEALGRGEVVAVKGIGGYHLACDATSDAAVERLRRHKQRPDKPFAVMVADLTVAGALAAVGAAEAALLTGPQRPIVLLGRRVPGRLAEGVAPRSPHLGVLLPYTPLHHLLFRAVPGAGGPVPQVLVMTSGNLSDEPICYDDADAGRRLGRVADAWLVHDRPIHVPCDDSVVAVDGGRGLPVRRSRGYAPLPVRLPFDAVPVFAAGGELKNAFCLASGRDAWMSQHIGDMGSLDTVRAFERSARQFARVYGLHPEVAAADAHPGYHTRRWADQHFGGQVERVQHHHAHVAGVMAEHRVPPDRRVIGFAFDGTGYGDDGAIWGGEVLVAGYDRFWRAAHLGYVPLPGGDAAVRKPYRAALAHLWAAGIAWTQDLPPVAAAPAGELAVLRRQLASGVGCVPTSSMGRLFDAVSSLLGTRHLATYEAQAALEVEAIAAEHLAAEHLAADRGYRFRIVGDRIDPGPVLAAMIDDLRRGRAAGPVAAGFHVALGRLVGETAERLGQETGIDTVALSGGVFQNTLLVGLVRSELRRRHLTVLTHRVVPPGDGGLALGQAAIVGRRPPRHGEQGS